MGLDPGRESDGLTPPSQIFLSPGVTEVSYGKRRRFFAFEDSARCYLCGETKPLADFPRDASKRSGRASRCKECDRAKSRAYYASK